MDLFSCPAELKFASDAATGEFSGYASVFGGLDSHGDRIAPGAFALSLAERKAQSRALPMYMQHGARLGGDPRPVGVWTSVEEDGQGLKVEGKLVGMDTEAGRYNHALIRDGAMRGLSIGYRARKDGVTYGKLPGEPKRLLKRIDLLEISVVDDPSDALARISQVKRIDDFNNSDWRDIEAALRDEGLSRADAVKAVSGFKAYLQRDAGEPDQEPRDEAAAVELRALAARIRALAA